MCCLYHCRCYIQRTITNQWVSQCILKCYNLHSSNSFGELGVPQDVHQFIVHPFNLEHRHVKFLKVACGDHNIIALTTEGQVYVTGYNSTDGMFHCIVLIDIIRTWIGSRNQYLSTHPQQGAQQIWPSN